MREIRSLSGNINSYVCKKIIARQVKGVGSARSPLLGAEGKAGDKD